MAGAQGNVVRVLKSRKDILLQGLSEYLTESALHGVKYFIGTRVVVKIFWVRLCRNFELVKFQNVHIKGVSIF